MHVATELDHKLMTAIGRRATNRRAFLPRPVSLADSNTLAEAAASEGATFVRLDPAQKAALATLVEEADHVQFDDPAFRAELGRWLVPRGSFRRDGIPFPEKEYGSSQPFALTRVMRSPALGDVFGLLEDALLHGSPIVAVIGTFEDDVPSWLACGQALESVLLHATSMGLSAAFMNQVLEVPSLRARVAELVPGVGYPQMVLRIGVPAEPIEYRSPRRDVDDVIEMLR
jgi:hypothetical protein